MAEQSLAGDVGSMTFAFAGPTLPAGTMGHCGWSATADQPWQPAVSGFPSAGHGAAMTVGSAAQASRISVGSMGEGMFEGDHDGKTWHPFGPRLLGNAGIVLALLQYRGSLPAGTVQGIYKLPLPQR